MSIATNVLSNERRKPKDPIGSLNNLVDQQRQQDTRKRAMEHYRKYGKGNIDLTNRPQYRQPDGSISTVNSISFGTDDGEVLVPTIDYDDRGNPRQLTDDEAIDRYFRTGEYLGKFDTVDEANDYADWLHNQQENYYSNPTRGGNFADGAYYDLTSDGQYMEGNLPENNFNFPEAATGIRPNVGHQRNVAGTATVRKGDEPLHFYDDDFNYIMENWPTDITAPYQEMYDNYQIPSEQEVNDLIAAHPELEVEPNKIPINPDSYRLSSGIVRNNLTSARDDAERLRLLNNFADYLGVDVNYDTLFRAKELGVDPLYIRALYDRMPEDEQRKYIMTSWPYDLTSQYMDDHYNMPGPVFNQMVSSNWHDVEDPLRSLALQAVSERR